MFCIAIEVFRLTWIQFFIATNWTTKSPLFVRHQQTSQRSPNESIHTAHWVRFSFGRISHWVCQATPSVISCGFPKDGSCYKLNQFDKQTHKRQRQITFEFLQQKTPSYLYRYSTYLYIFAVLWRLWNKISVNCMQTERTSILIDLASRVPPKIIPVVPNGRASLLCAAFNIALLRVTRNYDTLGLACVWKPRRRRRRLYDKIILYLVLYVALVDTTWIVKVLQWQCASGLRCLDVVSLSVAPTKHLPSTPPSNKRIHTPSWSNTSRRQCSIVFSRTALINVGGKGKSIYIVWVDIFHHIE